MPKDQASVTIEVTAKHTINVQIPTSMLKDFWKAFDKSSGALSLGDLPLQLCPIIEEKVEQAFAQGLDDCEITDAYGEGEDTMAEGKNDGSDELG